MQKQLQQEESVSSYSNDFNPCPICLGAIPQAQEAYLDQCFHKFCHNCILRWAKYVASQHSRRQLVLKCPLCKRDNASIIYDCEGGSFQQHYISKEPEKSNFFSKAHKFRLLCYYRDPGVIYDKFNVERFWKLRRYLQPNRWLQIWLKREIQALTQEEEVDVVMHHVLGLIESFTRQQNESKKSWEQNREDFNALIGNASRPFLVGRTERFVKELELFLSSGLTIEAYDQVYGQCLETLTSVAVIEDEEDTERVPYLHLFGGDSDTE